MKIVGAMLCSRWGNPILEESVRSLLKWCSWIFLILDQPTKEVIDIVYKIQSEYDDHTVRIGWSGVPGYPQTYLDVNPKALWQRFKRHQGEIRESVFRHLRVRGIEFDILLWPDSDEVFTNNVQNLLKKLWSDNTKKSIMMAQTCVLNDYKTILDKQVAKHTRIMKWSNNLTAIPYYSFCRYNPIKASETFTEMYSLVSLSYLDNDTIKQRNKEWKGWDLKDSGLSVINLKKDIRMMTPSEINIAFNSYQRIPINNYLKNI